MKKKAELGQLHARAEYLELLAIEAAVHLRATQRDSPELDERARTELLSIADRLRLTELLEREARLRGLAADLAQEQREVARGIRTGTVQRFGEVLKS